MTTIRPLQTSADYAACVAIQIEVWGPQYSDVTPPVILKIAQRVGGIALGAFEADGECVGFVFGLTGVEHGDIVHWSHQLGVRARARNSGIGRQLKEYQRDVLRGLGVKRIYWTFDPLQSKNAHLNLNRLGVEVTDYVPDMYGAARSSLFQGLNGTDRLIVAWDLTGAPHQPCVIEAPEARAIPLLGSDGGGPDGAARVRIEIPLEIQDVLRDDPASAGAWRTRTRPAFEWALRHGYRVDCLVRDPAAQRAYYVLSRV